MPLCMGCTGPVLVLPGIVPRVDNPFQNTQSLSLPVFSKDYLTDTSTSENDADDRLSDDDDADSGSEDASLPTVNHSAWQHCSSRLSNLFRDFGNDDDEDVDIANKGGSVRLGSLLKADLGRMKHFPDRIKKAAKTRAATPDRNLAMAILESYGAFGAPSGAWSSTTATKVAIDSGRVWHQRRVTACKTNVATESCEEADDEYSGCSCGDASMPPSRRRIGRTGAKACGRLDGNPRTSESHATQCWRWHAVGTRLASVFCIDEFSDEDIVPSAEYMTLFSEHATSAMVTSESLSNLNRNNAWRSLRRCCRSQQLDPRTD